SSDHAAPLNEANQYRDDGQKKKQMDEAAQGVTRHQPEKPQDGEDDGNSPKHDDAPFKTPLPSSGVPDPNGIPAHLAEARLGVEQKPCHEKPRHDRLRAEHLDAMSGGGMRYLLEFQGTGYIRAHPPERRTWRPSKESFPTDASSSSTRRQSRRARSTTAIWLPSPWPSGAG